MQLDHRYPGRNPAAPAPAGNSRRQPELPGASRQLPASAGTPRRQPV